MFFAALFAVALLPATAAFAQATPTHAAPVVSDSPTFPANGLIGLAVGVGLGLIIIGAGKGIGAIGSHAVDAIARQPEAGGRIFTSMIIAAALIEGVTLFAIVVALLLNGKIV
ncbi:MAG: ATP synthase F0 subunit C [Phycisphaeraceae bacterium]|nr:ATP synthase F0 subunit C [Phycisphaeraceae bacterium]